LGLEFSDTDEANGDVATRSAELFVGLGPVESLRTSRLPDLATAIIVGVHFFQATGTATLDQRSIATAEKGLPIDWSIHALTHSIGSTTKLLRHRFPEYRRAFLGYCATTLGPIRSKITTIATISIAMQTTIGTA